VLKDRQLVLEAVLTQQGIAVRDLVERYQPNDTDRQVIDAARKRFAAEVVAALEAPGSTAAGVGPTVRGVIDTVDRTMERLGVTRTMVGERLRALDAHEQALESGSIELQARLSATDSDIASVRSQQATLRCHLWLWLLPPTRLKPWFRCRHDH
jgi:hypothetical protein